jgi:sulfur-carrier protein
MPNVVLASTLARWIKTGADGGARELTLQVEGSTVGEALAQVFAQHPTLRGYVLDDQGVVRKHVAVFVDGTAIRDKAKLAVPVSARSEIHVMQALSGG